MSAVRAWLRARSREQVAALAVLIVGVLWLADVATDTHLRRAWAVFLALFLVSTASKVWRRGARHARTG